MSSNNDDLSGRSSGAQQPKRKRKNHKDHWRWSRIRWEDIMKTNMEHAFPHGALNNHQAQQEPQKVLGSLDCDLSLCLSTKIDDPHSTVSSAVGAGITYQAKKESAEGSHTCDLSLGLPIEVDIAHSILSSQGRANADASFLTGVLPENPSIGNIDMPAAVPPANEALHFSSTCNFQFRNLQSSLRNIAEKPSIFRKRRSERLSERDSRKADTNILQELQVGAGDPSGDPKPNSVSLCPLDLDLQTSKGKSISEYGSPSGVGLKRPSGLPSVDNDGFSLLLSVCQDEGWVQKDDTFQNPCQQTESLPIVSSEVPSLVSTDSVRHQSSKIQHASSLIGKEKLLDSNRKSLQSDFRSAFLEEGVEIPDFEKLSGLGSATPSSCASPSRSASERGSPSTVVIPSRTASKRGSPSTNVTPPREAFKNVSRSTTATPPKAASEKVEAPASATPPRAASHKVLPSASSTPPRAASQMVSWSARVTLSAHRTTPTIATNDQMRRLSNPSRVSSNQDITPSASSGRIKTSFKGVSLFKRTGRYEAHFWNSAERRQEYLGTFSTKEQAARAYDRATLFFRGRSAQLHFQLDDYATELPLLLALTKDQLLSMLKEQAHKEGSLYPTYPS